jgi:SAM-dependent methyltransferase
MPPPESEPRRACEACDRTEFTRVPNHAGLPLWRCAGCRLERQDPQPDDAALEVLYRQSYYDAWGLNRDEAAVSAMKRATFRRVLRRAGALPAGSRILDCGAATGFLMQAAREAGLEPWGVERSEFGSRMIAERFGADRVFAGLLEDAAFPALGERPFAAAFLCDLLEHVRAPEDALTRVSRLLSPGGRVVITTPLPGSFTHRLLRSGWTHYKLEHLCYFSREALERLLVRSGFRPLLFRPATKSLNASYVRTQMETYRHPLLTPLARGLAAALPARLRGAAIPVAIGEVLAVAELAGEPAGNRTQPPIGR